MTALKWDQTGEKVYETGVDHGILFLIDQAGNYNLGVAWNGLTSVSESPSGGEATPMWADNIKYLNLVSTEWYGATIEAYTYPPQFAQCDGSAAPVPGVAFGQQDRKLFGFAYRTRIGNDLVGDGAGYKWHLVWGALATPSEKAYATVNDTPEPITFSWEITTTPMDVGLINGVTYRPTASMTIDSTLVPAAALATFEQIIVGSAGADPRLPTPAEVAAIFVGAAPVVVNTVTPPTATAAGVITIPTQTGVDYQVDGKTVTGTYTIVGPVNTSKIVTAKTKAGYVFGPNTDDDFQFTKTA